MREKFEASEMARAAHGDALDLKLRAGWTQHHLDKWKAGEHMDSQDLSTVHENQRLLVLGMQELVRKIEVLREKLPTGEEEDDCTGDEVELVPVKRRS